jgi:hypothetical protein
LKGGERLLVLHPQDVCEQRVFALEVAVERALRDVGRGGNPVNVDASEAFMAKSL